MGNADMTPATASDEPRTAIPNTLTNQAMQEATLAGSARPLSKIITDFARYQEHWWLACNGYWLRITDTQLIATLDDHETRFHRHLFPPVHRP